MQDITWNKRVEDLRTTWAKLKRCRERDECFEKLARLGIIQVPIVTS
jgi:hypothetical protein